MSMSDPIADFLTRVRNAVRAGHAEVEMPWSSFKERLATLLVDEGYINQAIAEGEGVTRKILITLRYNEEGVPAITGVRRVSKPSLRVYSGASDAPRVRNGLGISVLSAPSGMLVDREARKQNVGGEVICEVW